MNLLLYIGSYLGNLPSYDLPETNRAHRFRSTVQL
jgi:hypothetical protein